MGLSDSPPKIQDKAFKLHQQKKRKNTWKECEKEKEISPHTASFGLSLSTSLTTHIHHQSFFFVATQ